MIPTQSQSAEVAQLNPEQFAADARAEHEQALRESSENPEDLETIPGDELVETAEQQTTDGVMNEVANRSDFWSKQVDRWENGDGEEKAKMIAQGGLIAGAAVAGIWVLTKIIKGTLNMVTDFTGFVSRKMEEIRNITAKGVLKTVLTPILGATGVVAAYKLLDEKGMQPADLLDIYQTEGLPGIGNFLKSGAAEFGEDTYELMRAGLGNMGVTLPAFSALALVQNGREQLGNLRDRVTGEGEEGGEQVEENGEVPEGFRRWGDVKSDIGNKVDQSFESLKHTVLRHKEWAALVAAKSGLPLLALNAGGETWNFVTGFIPESNTEAALKFAGIIAIKKLYESDDAHVPVTKEGVLSIIPTLELSDPQKDALKEHAEDIAKFLRTPDLSLEEFLDVEFSIEKMLESAAGSIDEYMDPSLEERLQRTTISGLEELLRRAKEQTSDVKVEADIQNVIDLFILSLRTAEMTTLSDDDVAVLNNVLKENGINIFIRKDGDYYAYELNGANYYVGVVSGLSEGRSETVSRGFTVGGAGLDQSGHILSKLYGSSAESLYGIAKGAKQNVERIVRGEVGGLIKDGSLWIIDQGELVWVGTVGQLFNDIPEEQRLSLLAVSVTVLGAPFVLIGATKDILNLDAKTLGIRLATAPVSGAYEAGRSAFKVTRLGYRYWYNLEHRDALRRKAGRDFTLMIQRMGLFASGDAAIRPLLEQSNEIRDLNKAYDLLYNAVLAGRLKNYKQYETFISNSGIGSVIRSLEVPKGNNEDYGKALLKNLETHIDVKVNMLLNEARSRNIIRRVPIFSPGSTSGVRHAQEIIFNKWQNFQSDILEAIRHTAKHDVNEVYDLVTRLQKNGFVSEEDALRMMECADDLHNKSDELLEILKKYSKENNFDSYIKQLDGFRFEGASNDIKHLEDVLRSDPRFNEEIIDDILNSIKNDSAWSKYISKAMTFLGPAGAAASVYDLYTATDKKEALAREGAIWASIFATSQVVRGIPRNGRASIIIRAAFTLLAGVGAAFGIPAAEIDTMIAEYLMPDLGAGDFDRAIWNRIATGVGTSMLTAEYIRYGSRIGLAQADKWIARNTGRVATSIGSHLTPTVLRQTGSRLQGVGTRAVGAVSGVASAQALEVMMKRKVTEEVAKRFVRRSIYRLSTFFGLRAGAKLFASLSSSVVTGPVGLAMAAWTAYDLIQIRNMWVKANEVSDNLDSQSNKDLKSVVLENQQARGVFKEHYEFESGGQLKWNQLSSEQQEQYILTWYGEESIQEKLAQRNALVKVIRTDNSWEQYQYKAGEVSYIKIQNASGVFELDEGDIGDIDDSGYQNLSFTRTPIPDDQYRALDNNPDQAEAFYSLKLLEMKGSLNFSQLDYDVMNKDEISIERYDLPNESISMVRSGRKWAIKDGDKTLMSNLDFHQAVGLANLSLYSFAKVKSFAASKNSWKSEDGSLQPFYADGSTIKYAKDDALDKTFMERQVGFYRNELGLTLDNVTQALNGYFSNHAAEHNLIGD